MKSISVRVAALLGLIAIGLASKADEFILYMHCEQVSNCGGATQVDDCKDKPEDAPCTFCTGGGAMRICRPGGDGCNASSLPSCGNRVAGACVTPVGERAAKICIGNQVIGGCNLTGC